MQPCDAGGYVDNWGCCQYPPSPIILDPYGNDIVMSDAQSGVLFDIRATSSPLKVAWPLYQTNAWLALDRNGNGLIDSGSELFGTATPLQSGNKATNGFK